ncbi:hypothetical protein, partial [Burkholderia stagnalis]|uniref:hypothetical protein n=1 Tax=Burkholderia stagnalis TaxID=1503054 RepID=UPI001C8A69FE
MPDDVGFPVMVITSPCAGVPLIVNVMGELSLSMVTCVFGLPGLAIASSGNVFFIANETTPFLDEAVTLAALKSLLAVDLRRNFVASQAVSLASILSESSQAR